MLCVHCALYALAEYQVPLQLLVSKCVRFVIHALRGVNEFEFEFLKKIVATNMAPGSKNVARLLQVEISDTCWIPIHKIKEMRII